MASVLPERQSVNGRAVLNQMFEEAYRSIEQAIAQRLTLWLEAALTTLLSRESHERRAHVRHWVEQNGECAKCYSHESRRFSRNGSRSRMLHYLDFTLSLRLPRVVCVCGGSVRLDFGGILRPYQRLGDDVDEQVQRWGKPGLSVRHMQSELAHLHLGPLALSTLTERLHRLKALNPARDPEDVQQFQIWAESRLQPGLDDAS